MPGVTDNYVGNPGTGGETYASDYISGLGAQVPRVKMTWGVDGVAVDVSGTNPTPVSLVSTTITGSVAVTGVFFQATQPVSGPITDTQIRATALPVSGTVTANATLAAETTKVIGTVNVGTTGGLALDATLTGGAQVAQIRAATLIVSTTAAAAAAVTLTLPAVAGQFHYITRVNIVKYATAAVVGAATPVVVTSTNLVGSLAWTTPTAQAVGTVYETDLETTNPIKSSVVNTATTIVCPATTSVIWRVNVYYYTAA